MKLLKNDREITKDGRVYIISDGRVFDKEKLHKLPFILSTIEFIKSKEGAIEREAEGASPDQEAETA